MLLQSPLSSEQQELVTDVRHCAVQSLELMNEVLDIYRFETSDERVDTEQLELMHICQHMVNRYKPLATAKQQNLLIQTPEDAIFINANDTLLKSILGNLLSNAIKYNQAGGTCNILIEKSNTLAQIVVEDNGPGFSKTDSEKVFGKFQTLSAQPTGNEVLSGLGLYMVKLMVEKLGGNIELETEEGQGAKFRLTFPL